MTAAAVVVGLDLNGLGVARSLGARGIRVIAVDTDIGKPNFASRYVRGYQISSLSGPSFIESLMRLAGQFSEAPVLLLTQEASVSTVSEYRRDLQAHFRFSMPDDSLVRMLLDKLGFQDCAERLEAPIPRAVRLRASDPTDRLDSVRFPCVLKPAVKAAAYSRRFAKAYQVQSIDEVRSLWSEIRDVMPEIIVQEWIDGADSDVYFCLQFRPGAKARATSFVGRKLRQWPPLVGGTASCVPAPEAADELRELTDRFFGAVGYIGLCSMEYKRDRRDGRFYMVEPTVSRTDYQEEVATLNGVNIPLAAYRAELGLEVPQMSQLEKRGWRDPFGDAKARAGGAPASGSRVPLCDAYWRLDDPFPSISMRLRGTVARMTRFWRSSQETPA